MITESRWDGRPINKPGVYVGVPMQAYHSQSICVGTSVSSSGLRRVLEENGGSPAHFFAEWDGNPNAFEPEETKALIFGSAVHNLFLRDELFQAKFVIRPDRIPDEDGILRPWSGLGCSVKAREEWLRRARATGRAIMTIADVQKIKGMAESMKLQKLVSAGILSGRIERTIVWMDEKTGLWVKCRPDAIPTDSGDFADLKTTTSVHKIDLKRTITKYAYHQQGALICTGSRKVLKINPSSYSLVFVEKEIPYCVAVVTLTDEDLALGEQQNRRALDLIHACRKAKRWPGPGDYEDAYKLKLEDWYRKRAEKNEDESDAA
jgi:hypothetical protein